MSIRVKRACDLRTKVRVRSRFAYCGEFLRALDADIWHRRTSRYKGGGHAHTQAHTGARRRRAEAVAPAGAAIGRHRRSVSVYSCTDARTQYPTLVKPYQGIRSLDCAQHIQTERHISNSQSHFARAACRCLIDCSSLTCHSVAGRK